MFCKTLSTHKLEIVLDKDQFSLCKKPTEKFALAYYPTHEHLKHT